MTDSLENHITAAKEGNQRAFSALLDAYWSDVYNFQLKKISYKKINMQYLVIVKLVF